jgi:hypothetical protein
MEEAAEGTRGNNAYLSLVFCGISKFKPYSEINLAYGIRETPNLSIRGISSNSCKNMSDNSDNRENKVEI